MAERILITGATGFLGGALARRLLARGVPAGNLRLLVRDPVRAAAVGLPQESLVAGDILDATSVASAVRGVDSIYHLAARTTALRPADFVDVNVGGTQNVVSAMERENRDARLVLVSSLAAARPTTDGVGSGAPPENCRPVSQYGRSKLDAERTLLAHWWWMNWTVVRPPAVYGPGDPATALLFRQATAVVTPVPLRRRPLSIAHVDDVVDCIERVGLERALRGHIPIEGAERTDSHDLMRRVARAAGRHARLLPVPMPLLRLLGPLLDGFARARGRSSFISSDKLREVAARGWVADPSLGERMVGFRARVGLDEGLAKTWAAMREADG
ncbi:MAG: NAD-dependent epimerase/dehydratase family protein [Planctomycetota bacterium]